MHDSHQQHDPQHPLFRRRTPFWLTMALAAIGAGVLLALVVLALTF